MFGPDFPVRLTPFGEQSSGHTVPEHKLLKNNKKSREGKTGRKIVRGPIGNSFSALGI
jgi:hypothetical protein